jgi:glycosyltransferase involved in cell wall biosynthesis
VTPPVAVALVLDTLTRGGAERILIAIANNLPRQRFRIHVITTRSPGEDARELADDVVVHSLDRASRWDLGALTRFAAIVRRNGIRLIHTHSHSSAYFCRVARALHRQRWVHVVHDHHGPVESSWTMRLADRALLRGVDHYFAVSERLARYAAESIGVPASRCERLPNGIALAPPAPVGSGHDFTIVQVARLFPEKQQLLAVEIAARLRDRGTRFQWLLIGSTESAYAEACRAEIARSGLQKQMRLLGERSDIGTLLAGADVGVLTSRYEALPIALLEYMAAGLPALVTDAGDCAATVQGAGGGKAISGGDVAEFVTRLEALANDPDLRRTWGAANREYIRRHHSLEAMVGRIEVAYDALLGLVPERRVEPQILRPSGP